MCDCPEIQKHCVLRPVLPKEGIMLDDNYIWVIVKKDIVKKKSIDSRLDNKSIWLPRQDQIQEMTGYKNKDYCMMSDFFYYWKEEDAMNKDFTSFEQAWLAFYMLERHRKSWGKKGWERVNNIRRKE